MLIRSWSYILALIFAASIMMYPMLELSHSLLHQFKNQIHHHHHDHNHAISDHHLQDHNEEQKSLTELLHEYNFTAFLLSFFKSQVNLDTSSINNRISHHTLLVCFYSSIASSPRATPPLA